MIVESNTVRFDSLSLDSGADPYAGRGGVRDLRRVERRQVQRHPGAARLLRRRARRRHQPRNRQARLVGQHDRPRQGASTPTDISSSAPTCWAAAAAPPGPASINPATGCPYAMSFPVITIGDMVRLQKMLIDSLGIPRLLAVSGGSMGGMQALEWAVAYPDRWSPRSRSPPPRATARSRSRSTKSGGQAIMADPDWNDGNYYGKQPPARGLAVARMVGHITYMSDDSMREKFGRRLRGKENFGFGFDVDFEVESYLRYRGSQFVNRFDANSYLYITKAMDYFDLTNGNGSLAAALEPAQRAFPGDQLQLGLAVSRATSRRRWCARCARAIATWRTCELQSNYGHDSFLVDVAEQTDAGARLPGQHVREACMTRKPRRLSSANCWAAATTPSSARSWSRRAKVLDLGCGEGELLEWLAQNKGVDARGVEISGAKVQRAIARGVSVFQGDIDEGAGRLSRPGVRLRDPQPDAAGDAPSAAGAARDAARGAARHRGVPEFRPLAVRLSMLISGRAPRTRAVSVRVVRVAEHPLPDRARFREARARGRTGGGAPLLPRRPSQGQAAAEPAGGSGGLPGVTTSPVGPFSRTTRSAVTISCAGHPAAAGVRGRRRLSSTR